MSLGISSQNLRVIRQLSAKPECTVDLVEDALGGTQLVCRRYEGAGAAEDRATEFRLLLSLGGQGSAHAGDIIDAGPERFSYTYEFIPGQSLNECATALPDNVKLTVLSDIAQAVANIHALGFVHCDLTPANVIVEDNGASVRARLIDLGFAARAFSRRPTVLRGTPGFVAPEILAGEAITATADIFAFGRIIDCVQSPVQDPSLREALAALTRRCTQTSPYDRPSTMRAIALELADLIRGMATDLPGPESQRVPLRPAGLGRRAESLQRFLRTHMPAPVVLVTGMRGVGKTAVMREFLVREQLAGRRTLRLDGIGSADQCADLIARLCADDGWYANTERSDYIRVVVSTTSAFTPHYSELSALADIAKTQELILIIEIPSPEREAPASVPTFTIDPLTPRECTVATSHITEGRFEAAINGEVLHCATGGIPELVARCTSEHMRFRKRRAIDPDVHAAAVDAYWRDDYSALTGEQQSYLRAAAIFTGRFCPEWLTRIAPAIGHQGEVDTLCRRGWLATAETDDAHRRPLLRFVARTARNFVARQESADQSACRAQGVMSDLDLREDLKTYARESWWALASRYPDEPDPVQPVRGPLSIGEHKVRARLLLSRAHQMRSGSPSQSISWHLDLSEALLSLGRSRGGTLTAMRGIRRLKPTPDVTGLDTPTIARLCRLLALQGDTRKRLQWLKGMLSVNGDLGSRTRAMLLSELGACYILTNDIERAQTVLHDARALLAQSAPDGEVAALILMRLGIVTAQLRRLDTANRMLTESVASAKKLDDKHLECRAASNVAWALCVGGQARQSVRWALRGLSMARVIGDQRGYLGMLSNLSVAYVYLGRTHRAIQVAGVAYVLAQALNDAGELARAATNLGHNLRMLGQGSRAREFIDQSLHLRRGLGDRVGELQSLLNMARIYVSGEEWQQAERFCRQARALSETINRLEGLWDCARVAAGVALGQGDFDAARRVLEEIPACDERMPPPDRIDAEMLRLRIALWSGERDEAHARIAALAQDDLTQNVMEYKVRLILARGHLHLLERDPDEAFERLSEAALRSRLAGRVDLQIEVLPCFALLARIRSDWSAGLRFLQTARELVTNMKEQLQT